MAVVRIQGQRCKGGRSSTVDAAPVGAAVADVLAHSQGFLPQFVSLPADIEDGYDSTHGLVFFG